MYFYIYIYIHTYIHDYSESVWSRADLRTHALAAPFRHCCQEEPKTGPVSPSPWQRRVGKQHFLQGIAPSLCATLPGRRWPGARSSARHMLPSPLGLPQPPCCAGHHHDFSWRPVGTGARRWPRLAPAQGRSKARRCPWRLMEMEGMDGGSPSSCPAASCLHCLHPDWPASRGFMVWGTVFLKKTQPNLKTQSVAKLLTPCHDWRLSKTRLSLK